MDSIKTKFWNNKKIGVLRRRHRPIKKYWFHDDIFKSTVFDAGSVWIPAVEDYIVKLLGKIMPHITDERLLKDADRLQEEESAHAFMHNHYNNMLVQEGYNVSRFKNISRRLLYFLNRHCSFKTQAAFCAGVEHLTACTSIIAVNLGILDSGVDERMRKVWLWHFLEEIDHRSIMFDIYIYLGGGYFRRVFLMVIILASFMRYEIRVRNSFLYQGGHWFDWSVHKSGWKFMWGTSGFRRHMIWSILRYLRPSFHPSQIRYSRALERIVHRYPIEQELASYFPPSGQPNVK